MLHKLLLKISMDRPARHIDSGGREYMYRIFLSEHRGTRYYLHWFAGIDGERHAHNHPFEGLSIVLCGAYREEILDPRRHEMLRLTGQDTARAYSIVTRRWWNRIPAERYHRIVDAKVGTWTLFLAGPPHGNGWGFLDERESGSLKFTPAESSAARWWETAPTLRQLLED